MFSSYQKDFGYFNDNLWLNRDASRIHYEDRICYRNGN